ncbi:MAG: response regulator [Gammaproteobacteria bacterium]|nr:response regulator [Gammaproteobacteria bacterium]NIR97398.1 response regulator [Gammaproteobacteria bacterium]NIT63051.1 response regulator [Gammaproteobacteria bacterium]NIV20013.1 response regulator [Gammaproteobacteria bacterium]NIX10089.1 response regulator [Gammaproteobacteria bacterium]
MLDRDAAILIVDDMKMIRTAIKRYLKELGYHNLIEAENGAEAVKKFKDNKIGFIFIDVVMPIMTGPEALHQIREMDTDVPIAVLSSVADQQVIGDCELYGVLDYILKPLNAESGPETLQKVLEIAWNRNEP